MDNPKMDDNSFFLGIIRTIAAVFCVGILTMGGCNMNRHYQSRVLVESGKTDALGARCAIDGDGTLACRDLAVRDMVKNAGGHAGD